MDRRLFSLLFLVVCEKQAKKKQEKRKPSIENKWLSIFYISNAFRFWLTIFGEFKVQ